MSEFNKKNVIGLTGSLGSGVTYAATILKTQKEFNFESYKISDFIKKILIKEDKIEAPTRTQMQDKGDALRKEYGNNYLATLVIAEINKLTDDKNIIIDGIRHPEEAELLKNTYANFFLISIDAPKEERWERYTNKYNNNRDEFLKDDLRDQGIREEEYGQKVSKCIDLADICLVNSKSYNEEGITFEKNLIGYTELIFKPGIKRASRHESIMTLAYTESLISYCIKRKVGAVITDDDNRILSTGYNNPPHGVDPCKSCYRDARKQELLTKMNNCPNCGNALDDNQISDAKCKKCEENLNKYIGKLLDVCRSLHAEERAIIQLAKLGSGISLENKTIYTTTFPCLLCANKIVDAKMKKVVYEEAYPVEESHNLLKEKGIIVEKFVGVKPKAFFRLFYVPNN